MAKVKARGPGASAAQPAAKAKAKAKEAGAKAAAAKKEAAKEAAPAEDAFEAAPAERVRVRRIDRAGVEVGAVAPDQPLAPGDDRAYTEIDTIVSDHNHVVALFPDILVDPEGDEAYNRSMMAAIRDAKELVVVEGYDLNREDFVDALIEKAKEGVEVAVLFDPADSPREKKKGELLDKLRDAKLKNLHVAEYGIVPNHRKSGFEQILHVKKVITDTPDGSLCEHSGGMNFSPNSINNLDFGWRTEGLAVIDSLRHVVEHWKSSTGEFPIDLAKVPDWNDVRAAAKKKVKAAKLDPVEVEVASAGRLPMEKPRTYSKAKLLERAQLGKKIIIDAREALKTTVRKNLEMAVHNGARVWVIEGDLTEKQKEKLDGLKKDLKDEGIHVFKENDVIIEDSYFDLVCRELDAAIEAKEPIEMAAFALSHPEVIDRLIAAHQAGCDVRVVVDDLQIEGNLINKKAMAQLSAAGVPVRAVDEEVKRHIAREWGGDEGLLKLHAKYCGLGENRVLGGSANFSGNGMTNNVEEGRLVRSKDVAKQVSARLFDPLWEVAKPIEPFPLVPDADRVPLIPAAKVGSKIEDLVFVVMDFETTGFVAKNDDRILQIAARAVKLDGKGGLETLGDFNQVVTPGTNLMGHPFAIPRRISNIVGIDEKNLEERGAIRMREALPAFVKFIEEQGEHGDVVLAGQNLPFDLRFFDHTMSREALGIEKDDGVVHPTLDGPYVDCIDVSERLFPDAESHNLDAHMERLDIPAAEDLPRHDAFADVVYTSEALARLVGAGKLKTLGDLLPPDLIELEGPKEMFGSYRKDAKKMNRLSFNDSGKLQIEVRDPRTQKLGGARRVYDLQVLDRKNDRLQVAVTTGRGDKAEITKGWIDEAGLGFRSGGRFYHQMREAGHELEKPQVVTP